MALGFRLPRQQVHGDTFKWLIHNQVPAVLDTAISYFASLPYVGTYNAHIRKQIVDFRRAYWESTGRELTISGIGSLFDFDTFGHQIRRTTPQEGFGGACSGNSLCLEPTCFGFTEGVIENNNFIQNMCWSLSIPCLKDYDYSDTAFKMKIRRHLAMFFHQAPAVSTAFIRTHLLRNAIKVVATARNFRYTGSVIGSDQGISLPFYIDPTDPFAFPDLSTIPGGIGGLNLHAFIHHVAPRLLSDAGFSGAEPSYKVYGLKSDYQIAKEQTASVMDHYMEQELLRALRSANTDRIDDLLGEFIHDPHFPTFNDPGAGNGLVPITQEVLEASTIHGYVQTSNPKHPLQNIRGLLIVPSNVNYQLVSPPTDNYSDVLDGLNFGADTPGVRRIMSSQMFSENALAKDGIVGFGHVVDSKGQLKRTVTGLEKRPQALREAIRTEVIMTYSQLQCAAEGQLPNVGPAMVPQGAADGMMLKSMMYKKTDWTGTAKPVLLTFKIDNPRGARPIVVCTTEDITVDLELDYQVVACGPGNAPYVTLTFNKEVDTADFDVDDVVAYRVGPKGATFLADVTNVSGNTVTIESSADPQEVLPCCAGQSDTYGTMAELLNITNAAATSSEIMKASYDAGSSILSLELFDPVVAQTANDTATITLEDGSEIDVVVAADATGVFVTVTAAGGETCDLGTLDCASLVNAVYTITA